ncbi:hypothetical protein FPQ18DRAFT_309435 [Pyronema domesticum]|nr:hypothetical protein FPQ18DRAFT_309435 [Pyronema domesticum]
MTNALSVAFRPPYIQRWWARVEAAPNKLHILDDTWKACGQQFPHVYRNEFICFNTNCARFFNLRDYGDQDAGSVFQYTKEFLNAETPGWEHCSEPPTDLNPRTFSLPIVDGKVDLDFVSRKAWKGWCCAMCWRLNSRNFSDRWQYLCQRRLWRGFHRKGYAIIEDEFASEISANRSTKDGYTVMTYDLPRGGRVTHMIAKLSANAQAGGADWLLQE